MQKFGDDPELNSLPGKSLLVGAKLVLFGRYILNFYIGIDK